MSSRVGQVLPDAVDAAEVDSFVRQSLTYKDSRSTGVIPVVAAHDAAIVQDYAPRIAATVVERAARVELAWSYALARRNRLLHDDDRLAALAPAVDMLMAVDER